MDSALSIRNDLAHRWYVLLVLTAVYVSNVADRYVISTLIEPIKAELHLSDSAIGFLTGTALALFYTILGLPLGALADRTLRRGRMLAICTAIWSVMTAACGLAASFGQLLLARIGVGIGEAGGTPASQSMIADLFPRSERVLAATLFAVGAAVGSMLGSSVGGLISDLFGWRSAFFALGVPGLIVATIVALTVREPTRTHTGTEVRVVPWRETLCFIVSQRSLLHVLVGSTVCTFWTWGLLWWTPAFLARSHHLTTGEAGAFLGYVTGIGGTIGAVLGGALLFGAGKRSPRWQCWIMSIITLLGTLASIVAYSTQDLHVAKAMFWCFAPVGYLYLVPAFSWIQNLAQPRMRGFVCAIFLFGANLANLALAPQLIGVASDIVAAHSADPRESLRAVLTVAALTGFWAAYHFWAAGERMPADLERMGESSLEAF
jgi:predicted MFS family arabinose efflux permease